MKVRYRFLNAALEEISLEPNKPYAVAYAQKVQLVTSGEPGSEGELVFTYVMQTEGE